MTDPTHTTASHRPVAARVFAASGISKAPGTQTSSMSSSATPQPVRPRRTPSRRRRVTWLLNRPHTMATRLPLPAPSRSGSGARSSRASLPIYRLVVVEEVAHAVALGRQVALVVGVGLDDERHAVDDLEAEALEAAVLRRVVGEEPHRRHAEVDGDLGADTVLAAVGGEAELEVGIDGVEPLLLELVGADLVADADATALVAPEVHDDTGALLGDHGH